MLVANAFSRRPVRFVAVLLTRPFENVKLILSWGWTKGGQGPGGPQTSPAVAAPAPSRRSACASLGDGVPAGLPLCRRDVGTPQLTPAVRLLVCRFSS